MDRFEELKKYKELMDEGIITEEEFNAKKKEFLAAPAIPSEEFKTEAKTESAAGSVEIGAALKKVGDGLKVNETRQEIEDDFKMLKKEGVKGLSNLSAGTALLITAVVMFILVGSLVMASHQDSHSSYSGSSGSSDAELTDTEIETFATYGVIQEIQDKQSSAGWNSEIEPYSCFINVNTYTRNGDSITVYGTCHFRDKYGNVVTKTGYGNDYSVNFEIKLSKFGLTESCRLE